MSKLIEVVGNLLWVNIDTNGIAAMLGFGLPFGDTTYVQDTMDAMYELGVDNETIMWTLFDSQYGMMNQSTMPIWVEAVT